MKRKPDINFPCESENRTGPVGLWTSNTFHRRHSFLYRSDTYDCSDEQWIPLALDTSNSVFAAVSFADHVRALLFLLMSIYRIVMS